MKKLLSLSLAFIFVLSATQSVFAAYSGVSYRPFKSNGYVYSRGVTYQSTPRSYYYLNMNSSLEKKARYGYVPVTFKSSSGNWGFSTLTLMTSYYMGSNVGNFRTHSCHWGLNWSATSYSSEITL